MNHFVFGTEVKRVVQLNHAKALVVPAGADTLEVRKLAVGNPTLPMCHSLLRLGFVAQQPLAHLSQIRVICVPEAFLDFGVCLEFRVSCAPCIFVPAVCVLRDAMQGIGLPSGCSRSDVEVGSIQARVAKYKRPCDDMFPASSSSGGANALLRLCPPPPVFTSVCAFTWFCLAMSLIGACEYAYHPGPRSPFPHPQGMTRRALARTSLHDGWRATLTQCGLRKCEGMQPACCACSLSL